MSKSSTKRALVQVFSILGRQSIGFAGMHSGSFAGGDESRSLLDRDDDEISDHGDLDIQVSKLSLLT